MAGEGERATRAQGQAFSYLQGQGDGKCRRLRVRLLGLKEVDAGKGENGEGGVLFQNNSRPVEAELNLIENLRRVASYGGNSSWLPNKLS